jgi:hypothetical protein
MRPTTSRALSILLALALASCGGGGSGGGREGGANDVRGDGGSAGATGGAGSTGTADGGGTGAGGNAGTGGRADTGGSGGTSGQGGACSDKQPTCPGGEVCDLNQPGRCTASTVSGTCITKPTACSLEYVPVCGCDRKTYGNDCERQAAGAQLDHAGPCV